MRPFEYSRAESVGQAVQLVARDASAKFLGGGTNLIDLMKYDVERPGHLVDVTHLNLAKVETLAGGGLRIGALVRNSDLAENPHVMRDFPVLSQALLAGASPQLRNMATTGGNLLQRTRCYYFYDTAFPCNKRTPGSGCSALNGFNRIHAVLGQSDACIAVHPSDMCVALAVLDAVVHVTGPKGDRTIPFAEFHRLPGDTPQLDTNLARDEFITYIDLPKSELARHSSYLKIRDRASYAFALVSVAAALHAEHGSIVDARLALGGVAHKPWRAKEAELSLKGHPPTVEAFQQAAELALTGAKAFANNGFKIEIAKRAIVRSLSDLGGVA